MGFEAVTQAPPKKLKKCDLAKWTGQNSPSFWFCRWSETQVSHWSNPQKSSRFRTGLAKSRCISDLIFAAILSDYSEWN
jgi:hypothetical protein